MRAFDFCSSQPWLITSEALETILAIAERTNDVDALANRAGRPLANARRVTVRDSVAIIPVTGPIFRYANLFTEISGATSTEILARDFRTALDDPFIQAIVLDMNSPGGMAAGINELADMVFSARDGDKKVVAYVGGQMSSAAYWIGSAATEIVIDRTAMLGSIGAKVTLQDSSERDKRAGMRTIEIVSSQSPDKLIDLSQDEGRAKIQKIVDDLAGVFVAAVARNRGVSVEQVLSDFGRGGEMVGSAALDAGLADSFGSLESVIAELSTRDPSMPRRFFSMKTPKGPIAVATTAALHAALAAGHTAEEITITSVDVDAIKAEARAAGVAETEAKTALAVKTAATEATAAERSRITGLQAIAMKGFEKEVGQAIEDGSTVEATAVALAKASRERGVSVASLATDAPGAVKHGGAGGSGAAASAQAKGWGTITERLNKRRKTG